MPRISTSQVVKRDKIMSYLSDEIVGPKGGLTEIISTEPCNYYISGVLFPVNRDEEGNNLYLSAQELDGKEDDVDSETVLAEQVSTLSGKVFPSSMGIHAAVIGKMNQVTAEINYAYYAKDGNVWRRRPFTIPILNFPQVGSQDILLSDGPGYVRLIVDERDGMTFIKAYIVNDGRGPEDRSLSDKIYQPQITLRCGEGARFANITRRQYTKTNLEDRVTEVLYRKHEIFARGYGCSAEWTTGERCKEIRTTFTPSYDIKPLRYDVKCEKNSLSLHWLSYGLKKNRKAVLSSLNGFIAAYEEWVKSLQKDNPDIDPHSEEARFIIDNCEEACNRMKDGIRRIEMDGNALKAFTLANLAMLAQSANRRSATKLCKGEDIWEKYAAFGDNYSWRPFQLAFLLLSIAPASDAESPYRDVVDLIWFPTGGGKTEAYLGVVAFTILLQRLRNPGKKFGTTVLSRYTMRLLTAQQFERAAALIAVLDIMSKTWVNELGGHPVSLGIWHGPNPKDTQKAEEVIADIRTSPTPLRDSKFAISKCPVCNADLLPARKVEDPSAYGFRVVGRRLIITCPDAKCPMHSGIPVCMVDQQIYEELPSVIIGTIDKFARLAWKEEPGWMLTGKNGVYPPPALIIQDELHLIAGPLGSLAGVYETAIEALCCAYGSKPHIIASTATVRRADEQCVALYGRHVKQFPPPGLDESDSFFARKDVDAAGRRYVGALAAHVSPTTAAVRMHALLLQSVKETQCCADDDLYWTLVSYFNSVKELGVATTLAADDIPDRLQVIQPDRTKRRVLTDSLVSDLYSERSEAELGETMRQLELKNGSLGALSLLLTTNIISVGIDIDRLGLMLVNGQPKSTAEYIQASSRVGRSPADMPGLVVTLYGATKPRDRSHFENFIPYHATLYGSVEPTSVTPFSKPARDRALHAVMVILARNLPGGIPANNRAKEIVQRPDLVAAIKEIIEKRVGTVAAEEQQDCLNDLVLKFSEWQQWASGALYYYGGTEQLGSLLHRKISPPLNTIGWRTMDSMRNVDFETKVIVEGDPAMNATAAKKSRNWRGRR